MFFLRERFLMVTVWLRRFAYCRGFGIQSPSVYRFVRYVINEHYPYYAYSELSSLHRSLSPVQIKLLRLYFRISNAQQSSLWVDFDNRMVETFKIARHDYITRGCGRTRVVSFSSTDLLKDYSNLPIVRLNAELLDIDTLRAYYQFLLPRLSEHSLLIIEGVHATKDTRCFWRELVADERTGITFDLYYCGLVFFDKVRHRCNYIINF